MEMASYSIYDGLGGFKMSILVYEIGSLSSWLSALGSIGALFLAIYLASSSNKAKYEVVVIDDKMRHELSSEPPNTLEVCITNIGIKTIHIKTIAVCGKHSRKKVAFNTALPREGGILKTITQGEIYKHQFIADTSNPSYKKYYICVTELSGKKYYKRLTP